MTPRITVTSFSIPDGLTKISGAFTPQALAAIEAELARERWLDASQAMRFSPLPPWVSRLARDIKALAIEHGVCEASNATDEAFAFSQIIVNQYGGDQRFPQFLRPHVDLAAFGELIASLSLRASCAMDFTPCDRATPAVRVELDPGDILILTGDARWRYEHGIEAPPLTDTKSIDSSRMAAVWHRISITFRTMDPNGHELTHEAR